MQPVVKHLPLQEDLCSGIEEVEKRSRRRRVRGIRDRVIFGLLVIIAGLGLPFGMAFLMSFLRKVLTH
jgi:hypothetical protein